MCIFTNQMKKAGLFVILIFRRKVFVKSTCFLLAGLTKVCDYMSVCTFLASDSPLSEVASTQEYPLEINIDTGTIYDGGADDNYFLLPVPGRTSP